MNGIEGVPAPQSPDNEREPVMSALNERMPGAGDFWGKLDDIKQKVEGEPPLSGLPQEWQKVFEDKKMEDYRMSNFIYGMWGKVEALEASIKTYAAQNPEEKYAISAVKEINSEAYKLASEDLEDLIGTQKGWKFVYPRNYNELPQSDFELTDSKDIESGRIKTIYRPAVYDAKGTLKLPAKVVVE